MAASRISVVGSAMADPNRAQILAALASGRQHTAGELARWIGLAPSTTSRHLARLVDAGLVVVTPSGRRRFFNIASEEVAHWLEQVDELELPETNQPVRPGPRSDLSFARSCYDHLAGEAGVRLYAAMVTTGALIEDSDRPQVSEEGARQLLRLGVDVHGLTQERRPLTRQCLDWTQREHHLGGSLGAALLEMMHRNKWVSHGNDRRVLRLTNHGTSEFADRFGCNFAS